MLRNNHNCLKNVLTDRQCEFLSTVEQTFYIAVATHSNSDTKISNTHTDFSHARNSTQTSTSACEAAKQGSCIVIIL